VFVTARELLTGVALDLAIGDPQWLPHPVRGLGWLASKSEKFWRAARVSPRLAGVFFWITNVAVFTLFVTLTSTLGGSLARIYWIFTLLACRDLDVEAGRVARALERSDLADARAKLAWIVGRDTQNLDEPEIVRATVETVAENLSDGVVAPLFWLALAGIPGMAAYKAINTLDSIAGYRNERYREFGWASARVDDLANLIPARLTALLIWTASLLPGFDARRSLRVTLRDGGSQPSPNAGYPEAAVAGALGVQLGGTNYYRGVASHKKTLGDAAVPLRRDSFPRLRVLLYATEGLCVAAIAGLIGCR
jgi:adenosylcobinamide-phosphate synthase